MRARNPLSILLFSLACASPPPIAPNDTAENLRKNRRTELTPIVE